MKKLFVILVAAAFVFGATSCKKECECKWDDGDIYKIPGETKLTKKQCEDLSGESQVLNMKWTCKHK